MTQPQEQGASAARTAGHPFGEPVYDPASEIATQVMNLPWAQNGPEAGYFDTDARADRHGDVQAIADKVIRKAPALASPADSAEMTAGEDSGSEWFWRIVDANGLGNVPSDEAEALRLLCTKAARYDEERSAPATPPGVPDSVRVKVHRDARKGHELRDSLFLALADCQKKGTRYKYLTGRTADDLSQIADFVAEAFSAHPAGQSTGLGAEDTAEQFIQAAVDGAPEPLKRLGRYLADVLDEDQFKTAERMLLGGIALSTDRPAPDSTRTGPVGTGAEDLFTAIDRMGQYAPTTAVNQLQRLAEAALAARPAAPEAQGAWRPIETAPKDGTHIIAHDEHYGVCEAVWRSAFDDLAEEPFEGLWDLNHSALNEATGWQPMPAPPSSGQGGR